MDYVQTILDNIIANFDFAYMIAVNILTYSVIKLIDYFNGDKPVTTLVTKEFNCCACLLCFCTGLIWYVCIQACRGKDICCYDARHTCPSCGNVLGQYTAC